MVVCAIPQKVYGLLYFFIKDKMTCSTPEANYSLTFELSKLRLQHIRDV